VIRWLEHPDGEFVQGPGS